MKKVFSIMIALLLFLNCRVPVFAAASYLSESEVKEIVLAHTGVDAEDVVFTKIELDKEDNEYEIKFTCGIYKYEYEINAENGNILSYEWEIKKEDAPVEHPNYSENLRTAEESALAELGIARKEAKYIHSYVKYDENHIAYAIRVEIGVYDKTVSLQTVVYSFDFRMDGEIIERPAPIEPDIPDEPITPDEPDIPNEPNTPDQPTTPLEPIEPGNSDESEPNKPENPQHPDYNVILRTVEESALAALGITQDEAKYMHSYVKYDENHIAYAIRVEIGIYDKTVSLQTLVYDFEFDMDGVMIKQPDIDEPDIVEKPTEPAEPDESVKPDKPTKPDESIEPDEFDEPDESIEPDESEQPETIKDSKKKTVTKSIKVNSTKVTLKKGQKFAIKVTRNPVSATDKITYSTTKKKVASVSKKGVITAKAKGSCRITVKCNGKKKGIKVTVK